MCAHELNFGNMSCLLPQFKCLPDSFSAFHFKTHHHASVQSTKNGETMYCRPQCAASTSTIAVLDMEKLQIPSLESHSSPAYPSRQWSSASTTATVLDLEKLQLPSLEACSNSVVLDKPWTFHGSLGPPKETKLESTLEKEKLLTSNDAIIAAAAAEAVALATAAVKSAKNAASMMVSHHTQTKPTALKIPPITENFVTMVGPTTEEEISDALEHSKNVAVRSRRQFDRKIKRSKAAEKAAARVVSVKSVRSTRKKRVVQEIDYSDPLRYLRNTTSGSKLLTAAEERKLSEGVQEFLKLERLQKELMERCGCEPTFPQWADAAGVDTRTLRQKLSHGAFCKEKMIKCNVRLVISIAKNYVGAGMNLQDLVQEGCRGLIRGVEKFDATRGFKFSTYAHWWIKQAVRKSLSDQSRLIRLPFHMVEATYKVKEARKNFEIEHGRNPTDEEILAATGLTMTRLTAVKSVPRSTQSLDEKVGFNKDLKPMDILVDPDAETPEQELMKELMHADLNKAMDALTERERVVIRWRYGLGDNRMRTLQEIGDLMGVSRERVRQIESYAFRKLRTKKKQFEQYIVP